MSDENDVLELENRRAAAIKAHDIDAMADCLAEDYLHVLGQGKIFNKTQYVDYVRGQPRVPVRTNMRVRVYGDAASLIGDLLNNISEPDGSVRVVDTTCSQMAVRRNGKWQFVSCQLTPKPQAS